MQKWCQGQFLSSVGEWLLVLSGRQAQKLDPGVRRGDSGNLKSSWVDAAVRTEGRTYTWVDEGGTREIRANFAGMPVQLRRTEGKCHAS